MPSIMALYNTSKLAMLLTVKENEQNEISSHTRTTIGNSSS